jgi:hypothetical protein
MVKLDTLQIMSSVIVWDWRAAGRAAARPASTIGRAHCNGITGKKVLCDDKNITTIVSPAVNPEWNVDACDAVAVGAELGGHFILTTDNVVFVDAATLGTAHLPKRNQVHIPQCNSLPSSQSYWQA